MVARHLKGVLRSSEDLSDTLLGRLPIMYLCFAPSAPTSILWRVACWLSSFHTCHSFVLVAQGRLRLDLTHATLPIALRARRAHVAAACSEFDRTLNFQLDGSLKTRAATPPPGLQRAVARRSRYGRTPAECAGASLLRHKPPGEAARW